MPMIGRSRLLRIWGGIMDMSMDGSPFIDKTNIKGLILMAAGAMADLKQLQQADYVTRIFWQPMNLTKLPPHSG